MSLSAWRDANREALASTIARFTFAGRNLRGADPFLVHLAAHRRSQKKTKEEQMISRRSVLLTLGIAALPVGARPVLAAPRLPAALRGLDTDNDGTLDLAEVKKAASALFAKLDRDHDGTLDKRELAGRLSVKEFAAADPDHDGTLTADEYLAVVEQRFNAADPDKDGTLDAKELNSSAGRALLRLLR
jgi:EF hand